MHTSKLSRVVVEVILIDVVHVLRQSELAGLLAIMAIHACAYRHVGYTLHRKLHFV